MQVKNQNHAILQQLGTYLATTSLCPVCCCRCIKYLRLFTSKGQKVAVGRVDRGFESQARNVTKNRDNGRLAAIKGWQDAPVKHGEFVVFSALKACKYTLLNNLSCKQLLWIHMRKKRD